MTVKCATKPVLNEHLGSNKDLCSIKSHIIIHVKGCSVPDLLWVIGLQRPYHFVTIWLLFFAYHMFFVCLSCMFVTIWLKIYFAYHMFFVCLSCMYHAVLRHPCMA